jgi:plasmid stabilization system protein ParE
MRRFTILISQRAAREIDAAHAWRAEHAAGSPGIIGDELAAAFRRLEALPEIGPRWTASPTVRRIRLDRIGYHLYYDIDVRSKRITVLCFWHERRRAPRL